MKLKDTATMEEPKYTDTVLEQAIAQLDREETLDIHERKNGHGGKREGSGRKRQYEPCETTRLKCRHKHADIAKAFISILDKFSNYFENKANACMLDGSMPETKGSGSRTWTEHDAISSWFSIEIDGSCDKRIFALAFRLTNPTGVKADIIHDDHVWLRWQRIDEVTRVMSRYGWLMAKRKSLGRETESILDGIPYSGMDITDWINKKS